MRIGRAGFVNETEATAWAALRDAFARTHVVRLPGLFGADLLDAFDRRLAGAAFTDRVEDGVRIERQLADGPLLALATVVLNDPALFRAVEALAGCGPIGCFTGRVYARQGASEYYPWHSDCVDDRLVALSVNLGAEPFEGGVLEVRRAADGQVLGAVHHERRGDGALVRIRPDLEHRVTPVTSAAPRLVLAGWFRGRPSLREALGLRAGTAATRS